MNSQLNGETKKEILRKQCEKCHYGDTERKLLKYIRESHLSSLENASQRK